MTKTEIISRIINRITDPWTDCPENYEYADPITLSEAEKLLKQYRYEDSFDDLEPDEKLPEETTPALLMEAHNCNIRYQKFELRVERLAEYITGNEMICEYDNYYRNEFEDAIEVIPVDFLYNSTRFPFSTHNTENPDIIDMLRIGLNSAKTFNCNHLFCWFDKDNEVLHSTNTPFADGVLDAEAFARFVLCDADALGYFLDAIMDDDDIKHVFGCTKDELIKEDF